jgi:hypothetical protein
MFTEKNVMTSGVGWLSGAQEQAKTKHAARKKKSQNVMLRSHLLQFPFILSP